MTRSAVLAPLATIAMLAACANSGANYVPVIDGPVGPNFDVDLAQCQGLAASQGQLDSGTATAAVTGAGLAGATSVILNDNSDNLGRAAAAGAVAGLTSDAIRRTSNQEVIVRNCMRGRGYNVVG